MEKIRRRQWPRRVQMATGWSDSASRKEERARAWKAYKATSRRRDVTFEHPRHLRLTFCRLHLWINQRKKFSSRILPRYPRSYEGTQEARISTVSWNKFCKMVLAAWTIIGIHGALLFENAASLIANERDVNQRESARNRRADELQRIRSHGRRSKPL